MKVSLSTNEVERVSFEMTCLRFLSKVPVHVVEQTNFTPMDFRLSLYEAKQEITGLWKMHNNFDCLMEQSKPVTSPKNQGKKYFFSISAYYSNCDNYFNPCGIFQKMMSFTQILNINRDSKRGK